MAGCRPTSNVTTLNVGSRPLPQTTRGAGTEARGDQGRDAGADAGRDAVAARWDRAGSRSAASAMMIAKGHGLTRLVDAKTRPGRQVHPAPLSSRPSAVRCGS